MTVLLNDAQLEPSAVVANCRMNRERSLSGSNGYSRELGLHPLEVLREKAKSAIHIRWLDVCCGTGNALLEAAQIVEAEGWSSGLEIVGVDLVGMFAQRPAAESCLQLVTASISSWKPTGRFDLITCVHGLHYLGDKLGAIGRMVSWLKPDGRFVANFSLENIQLQDNRPASRVVATWLKKAGLRYDGRWRRLACNGHRWLDVPYQYLGANDQAGPNYTGQPAVNSHYAWNDSGCASC